MPTFKSCCCISAGLMTDAMVACSEWFMGVSGPHYAVRFVQPFIAVRKTKVDRGHARIRAR